MKVLSKSTYLIPIFDAFIIAFSSIFFFAGISGQMLVKLLLMALIFVLAIVLLLASKDMYKPRKYQFKDLYTIFEAVFVGSFIASST